MISGFPEACIRHLTRVWSDHCPLLLSLDPCPPHLRPFRFEAMWLKHHDFNQVVTASWNDNHLNFCSNAQVFGHLQQRKKKVLARLNGVQRALWNKANLNLERDLQDEFCQIMDQ